MANRAPDPNGDEKQRFERRLARAQARFFRGQQERVVAHLRRNIGAGILNPGPPDTFWQRERALMLEDVRPILLAMAERGALNELEAIFRRRQIAGDGILDRVLAWVDTRAGELIDGITATTQGAVQRAIRRFFTTPGFTIGDLEDSLLPLFGAPRAMSIAVTEVTTSFTAGVNAVTDEIRSQGFEVVEIWNTNNDGLVCPICRPFNRKKREVWGRDYPEGPPAHVNCRCWKTNRIAGL